MNVRPPFGDRVFHWVNYGTIALLSLAMIYPFWYIIMYSFSDPLRAASGGLFLIPRGFSLKGYLTVFRNSSFLSGLRVSVTVTVIGTFAATFLTATTAYPLSRRRFKGRSFFAFMILFTMLFHGGMVPTYLLVKGLGLMDSLSALILPIMLGAWNVFIMRNFFMNVPDSMEESAKIDGASDFVVFFAIILPLSKAVLATVGLFIAVMYWNDFFSTVLYIISKSKWSLQAVLRDILVNTQQSMAAEAIDIGGDVTPQSIIMANIMVATIPILALYPFLQKHFVKGVLVGSIK